jgi:hypothetical protein
VVVIISEAKDDDIQRERKDKKQILDQREKNVSTYSPRGVRVPAAPPHRVYPLIVLDSLKQLSESQRARFNFSPRKNEDLLNI